MLTTAPVSSKAKLPGAVIEPSSAVIQAEVSSCAMKPSFTFSPTFSGNSSDRKRKPNGEAVRAGGRREVHAQDRGVEGVAEIAGHGRIAVTARPAVIEAVARAGVGVVGQRGVARAEDRERRAVGRKAAERRIHDRVRIVVRRDLREARGADGALCPGVAITRMSTLASRVVVIAAPAEAGTARPPTQQASMRSRRISEHSDTPRRATFCALPLLGAGHVGLALLDQHGLPLAEVLAPRPCRA